MKKIRFEDATAEIVLFPENSDVVTLSNGDENGENSNNGNPQGIYDTNKGSNPWDGFGIQ